ncbi:MAG TPA: cold shock domain-containing protein [Microvirga sp.]|jgi:CspA family cold shock protein|nr:cold shock domain-containing protein [Microvirga sp.]
MPRALKPKTLTRITPAREGSTYQLEVEDEAGKRLLFELTSDQALLLAEQLDGLLADEEDELHPRPAAFAQPISSVPAGEGSLGTVKWFNPTKGFGFVTPDGGGEELFLHRSVLVQAGLRDLAEGTRVRVQTSEGAKGPQVSALSLA